VTANYTTSAEPVSIAPVEETPLDVTYRNGLLGIRANKATLSEVLYAVQQRTGADVSIAAGAEQEKVVADIAPGPAPEVLARLLNGSKFNFVILSAVDNPQRLDRVILSARPDGAFMPLAPVQVQNADDSEDREPSVTNLQPGNRAPAPTQVPQPPDGNAPADENTPNEETRLVENPRRKAKAGPRLGRRDQPDRHWRRADHGNTDSAARAIAATHHVQDSCIHVAPLIDRVYEDLQKSDDRDGGCSVRVDGDCVVVDG